MPTKELLQVFHHSFADFLNHLQVQAEAFSIGEFLHCPVQQMFGVGYSFLVSAVLESLTLGQHSKHQKGKK